MRKLYRYISILAVVSGIAIAVYYFVRVYFFVSAHYTATDRIFGSLLIIGETYMIIHAFGYIVSIVRLKVKHNDYRFKKLDPDNLPGVAVFLPIRHEPAGIVEQTLVTLSSLNYANKKIYILDGSTEESFLEDDRKLAEKYGAYFFHPEQQHGAKAGIINDFLGTIEQKYIAIFDADQNPLPDFLLKVVALAESSSKIAFVQTPQFYSNLDTSPIARGAQMQQSVFFETVCESKSTVNAMFCCGTNVLFRKEALLEVGGFDEESITEDFATSVKLHFKGYKSVYYSHVQAFGMAPESLPAYFKQQARWAAGTVSVFRKLIKLFFRYPWKLTLNQWWEYFLSGSYYFTGWAFFFLMLSPIIFLTLRVPSYFMEPQVYLVIFIPYFVMTLGSFYATMKKRHYDLSQVYNGIILGSLSFPVLMKATLLGFFGKKMVFKVTPKGKAEKMHIFELWPWILMIGLNFIAIIFGLSRLSENFYATGINIFWCFYHIFLLSQIFKFNVLPKIPAKLAFET